MKKIMLIFILLIPAVLILLYFKVYSKKSKGNNLDLDTYKIEVIEKLKDDPKSAYLHHQYCVILFGENKYDAALKECMIAIELMPDNPSYYSSLSIINSSLGNKQKELINLYKFLELDENNPHAYFSLARYYNSIGYNLVAEFYYEKSKEKLSLIPTKENVYYDSYNNAYTIDAIRKYFASEEKKRRSGL